MKLSLVNLAPLKEDLSRLDIEELEALARTAQDIQDSEAGSAQQQGNFDSDKFADFANDKVVPYGDDGEHYSMNDIQDAIDNYYDKRGDVPYDVAIGRMTQGEYDKHMSTVKPDRASFEKNSKYDRMNEDKELDPYQKSIAAKWDEETKEGGEFDTTRELEKNDVKQFMANMAAKTAFLTKLRDDGKFNKKTPPSDDKIEMWVIKPKIPGFKIAGMLKPETNELKEMKKSNNKNLLIERFQELAGIKPLYENEDRKADHASFEFDNYTDDGSIPLPTAGWWEDGTEMTEDELEAYYDKMGDSTMHTIMHDNLGEGEDLRLEPEEEDSYRDMIKGKYSDDDLKLEPEIDEGSENQTLQVTSERGTVVLITDPEDIKAFLAGEEVYGEDQDGGSVEVSLDNAQDHQMAEGSCGYSQEAPGGEELDTPGGTQGMDADERTRGMLKIFIQKEIKKLKEGEPGDFDRDLEDLLGKDDFAKATSNEVPGLGDTVIDDKTDITTSKKTFMQMMMQFTDEPFLIETGLKLYDAWANGEGGLKPSRILDILKQSSSN